MNKRGFTLIEVLVVIIIIGLISGIGIVAYNAFFDTAKDKYYNSLESNMLLAGNDYFEDHRDLLPLGNDYSIVSLVTLIEDKYIDPVKDYDGKECLEGTVFAYRENNKFKYEACLKCENYESSGSFCEGPASKKITATGKKVGTNESYNVTKSYNSQEYSNGKDIEVTYSMTNEIPVAKYVTTNTSNSSIKKECTASNNSCSVIIDSSGTYKVVAYDNENKEISSIYISAKIAKGTLAFRLEGETKYLLGLEECNGDKKATVTINIIRETQEEYKRIMYRINGGSSKEATGLKIVEELESGHYTIEVVVIEHTNKETLREFNLDISYKINYEYDDDHTTGTHEVVKGKPYNFLSSLPKKKESYGHNLDIKWTKDNVEIDPDTKIVEDNCTHQLIGKMSVPVTVPSDLTAYCNTLTYTGDEQTLTKAAPENITFLNNKGTNAGEYTVKAHINSPQYIWTDGTFDDKEFKCSISKATNPISVTASQSLTASYSTSVQDNAFTAASGAQGAVTYAIQSQKKGSTAVSSFSVPTASAATLRMAASTGIGTYTVVIRATAAGNDNYNSGYKDITMTVTVGKAPNPISVTASQTWNTSFNSTSAQDKAFTAASGAQGAVTYAIQSQKKGSTAVSSFSVPTASAATLRMAASTGAGTYTVVIRATAAGNDTYNSGYKDITMTVTVGKAPGYISGFGAEKVPTTLYPIYDGNTALITYHIRAMKGQTGALSVTATGSLTGCSTGNSNVMSCSVSGNKVYITGVERGTTTITISIGSSDNYNAGSFQITAQTWKWEYHSAFDNGNDYNSCAYTHDGDRCDDLCKKKYSGTHRGHACYNSSSGTPQLNVTGGYCWCFK